ncbi:hypothetical protein RhiirA4_469734 [Rhizophagus irregularis]|uniref:Uncharacterized protein n=1 Tax=Rhizophagus irregularis TaxID=588596 RepID=A0A2I1H025_9GLOM|nr:hypothetical protein RhiirA4_469734 [Rhizophagus irregularis]
MSSKNYGQKACRTSKICSDCEEMSDSVKLFSSKNTNYQKFCNNNNKYSSTIENIDNESDDK